MTEAQAIEAANSFLLKDQGIRAAPVQVVRLSGNNRPSCWVVRYGTSILFPKETSAGSVIDEGDYILKVECESGRVTRLG